MNEKINAAFNRVNIDLRARTQLILAVCEAHQLLSTAPIEQLEQVLNAEETAGFLEGPKGEQSVRNYLGDSAECVLEKGKRSWLKSLERLRDIISIKKAGFLTEKESK